MVIKSGISYYRRHKEAIKTYNKVYSLTENSKLSHRKYSFKVRSGLVNLLGGKCVDCGYDKDIRVLELDHINNDGNIDRKRFPTSFTLWLYYHTHPEEAKLKLQVLCANCNRIKMYEHRGYYNSYGKK